jgi:hypothetical protein
MCDWTSCKSLMRCTTLVIFRTHASKKHSSFVDPLRLYETSLTDESEYPRPGGRPMVFAGRSRSAPWQGDLWRAARFSRGNPDQYFSRPVEGLEDAGLIASSPYQQRPVRYAYSLTEKGTELGGILLALVQWGKRHIPGTRTYKDSEASARYSKSGRRVTRAHSERRRTS